VEILYSQEKIAARVREMGQEITRFYEGKPLTVVIIATGGVFFAADLLREIKLPLWADTIAAASYIDDRSCGRITLRSKLKLDCSGRHVLLVDEMLDTGGTLRELRHYILGRGALSVRSAVIVEKDIDRPGVTGLGDWIGFVAPNRFLVGYGLDFKEDYRNLPYIAALD
jgi:hypoxanthine phosphoribosyltransferase